jgi:peroxiredoxin
MCILLFCKPALAQDVLSTDSLNFSLVNVDGQLVALSQFPDAKGFMLVFTCNHCPFAKLYPERLNDLNHKYLSKGVPLIAVSSTDSVQYEEDGFVQMVKYSKKEKFSFPYLYDRKQQIAKSYRAQKTPHAFLVWKENGHLKIVYEGAIDDNGMHPSEVKQAYLSAAVDNMLAGKPVEIPHTKSVGCQIYFR